VTLSHRNDRRTGTQQTIARYSLQYRLLELEDSDLKVRYEEVADDAQVTAG